MSATANFSVEKKYCRYCFGVFGTIVGYYFGSTHAGATAALRVSGIEAPQRNRVRYRGQC